MTESTNVQAAAVVLETKLHHPSAFVPLITRTRLLDHLNAQLDRRLILVSAPAGYGKTTLVSQWMDSVGEAQAWLSLDEHDNELTMFLLYLVAAIRTIDRQAMGMLDQLLRAPALPPQNQLANAFLQDVAAIPDPFVLVLDDYHVIETLNIHAFIERLATNLPQHVCLVLITRSDPPLPLERLRGRRQLGEIRAADLRFNSAETMLFLQQMLGSRATEDMAALLENSTEGWVVGLHLAALSLRNSTDPAAFVNKIAHYGHQSITEYLLSEVLASLPTAQRECLLLASLFDRFCAPLIDAAQAEEDVKLAGNEFVRDIRRANLFVVSLDDQGIWFRFHHIFQHLLRVQLKQRYAAAVIKANHARASVWFSQQNLVDEAIIHALKAGDPTGAAELVEAQVVPALDHEDWKQIEHWIGLLPADVKRRPRLLLAQAWLHFFRWQFRGVQAHVESAEAALDAELPALAETEITLRGEIVLLRAALAQNSGDTELALQYSKAALAALRPDMHYLMGLAHFYYIWGLQVNGEYEKAIDYAHRQLDALGWQADGLSLRLILALAAIHYEMANVAALQDIITIWLELSARSGLGISIGWSRFAQGWLAYQKDELAAAEVSFRRVTEMVWLAHGRAVFDSYTGLVLTLLAQDRRDEASHVIVALNKLLLERGMLPFSGVAQSLEQRVALARGSESALAWRLNEELVPASDILWEMPALTQVLTLLAAGGSDELVHAVDLLADCRAKSLARNANRRLIEIGALQALVLSAQEDETAALDALQEAVERAEPGGTLRLLADFGPGLTGLLQKLRTAGVAPSYIDKVLGVLDGTIMVATVPETLENSLLMAETLTNREIDVLLLLAERLTDKEIAARLVLSPLTVKKHTQRIYRKLGVHNRRAAVLQSRRLGLI